MKLFITGGTGFLGNTLVEHYIQKKSIKKIIIYSRRWADQERQLNYYTENYPELAKKLRFITGDIRDRVSLFSAMQGCDTVIHTAAYKHVVYAEYNPREVISVNITGSQNVIDSAIASNVKQVLAISTDKATDAFNLYGRTKAVMESMMVSANNLGDTTFNVARYGNVWNSTGSIVQKWAEQLNRGKLSLKITDPAMTRFFIFKDELIRYMEVCLAEKRRGLIMLPVMRSVTVANLARCYMNIAIRKDMERSTESIGARSGEKHHESLLSDHEKPFGFMLSNNVAAIFPSISDWGTTVPSPKEAPVDELMFRSNTTLPIPSDELEVRILDTIYGTIEP